MGTKRASRRVYRRCARPSRKRRPEEERAEASRCWLESPPLDKSKAKLVLQSATPGRTLLLLLHSPARLHPVPLRTLAQGRLVLDACPDLTPAPTTTMASDALVHDLPTSRPSTSGQHGGPQTGVKRSFTHLDEGRYEDPRQVVALCTSEHILMSKPATCACRPTTTMLGTTHRMVSNRTKKGSRPHLSGVIGA